MGGEIPRDTLQAKTKSSLGSALTLFQLSEEVGQEFISLLKKPKEKDVQYENVVQDAFTIQQEYESIELKSREFIKDKINALSADDMEKLVAGVLRAMGFKTRISPKGRDRGLDVLASPDGFGLQSPTIKAQVKHKQNAIGAPEMRTFISILRSGEKGLYVSTGGFTNEARYEGDRASTSVSMIDNEELLNLIIEHYDQFDASAQMLLPLTKTYWPQ